jgi:hypothetical protein
MIETLGWDRQDRTTNILIFRFFAARGEENIHTFTREINTRKGTIRLLTMFIFVEYAARYSSRFPLVLHAVSLRDDVEKGLKHSERKSYSAWEMSGE